MLRKFSQWFKRIKPKQSLINDYRGYINEWYLTQVGDDSLTWEHEFTFATDKKLNTTILIDDTVIPELRNYGLDYIEVIAFRWAFSKNVELLIKINKNAIVRMPRIQVVLKDLNLLIQQQIMSHILEK